MTVAELTPQPVPDRTAHPFHTYEMIQEIPAALRETLRTGEVGSKRIAARLSDRPFLYFTGCGTAFFSALLARQFAAAGTGPRTQSAAVPALEFSSYTRRVDATCGVIGVSHSGITKATVDALHYARGQGARTIGITHFRDRPIAEAADEILIAGNGPDLSRCHTKCYVTGAAAAAQVALGWRVATGREAAASVRGLEEGLDALPGMISGVLRSAAPLCEELAGTYLAQHTVYAVGAGPNVPTAFEVALKLKETSFLAAEGMETEQFLHGPWVALNKDCLVLAVAPEGPSHGRSLDLVKACQILGVPVVAIVTQGDREIPSLVDHAIEIPEVDEILSPFLAIAPLYLYAYYSSVKRGNNPDLLRYLDPTYWRARSGIFPPGTH